MATKVIHIKDSTGGYNEVYIGRSGNGYDGYFGNPAPIGGKCKVCGDTHKDRGSTLTCYRKYLLHRISSDIEFKERVYSLKDKTLVCFCKPKPCHGDVIAETIDSIW